ncbi:MAG TPA: acetoin utilization protein AcuC [Nitrososphaerales archaeon]|nr:acetoin utilization protein AcuC [Nitrososphaerales archaeon]
MNCRVGVLEGPELLKYSFPPPHPLNASRAEAFWKKLSETKIEKTTLSPKMATAETIELFHLKEHVRFVQKASEYGSGTLDHGDTPAFKGVYEASQYMVGSTVEAAEQVLAGTVDHAFNPVGGLHHARRDSSAGFCVFNDICVAVEVLRQRHGLKKVLYVDIDVHHGDGVYYSYEEDPDLYIFDIHEDGRYIYPGTGSPSERGSGRAEGTKVNVAFQPGASDLDVYKQLPKLEKFVKAAKPEFIILQCGADGLANDPIGGLRYTAEAHGAIGSLLHRVSHEVCEGRLIALGGGGYDSQNCADAWVAVVSSFTKY